MLLSRIIVDQKSFQNLELIKNSLGYKAYSIASKKLAKKVDALGTLALNAYQSKVPVDTLMLRNANISRTPKTFTRLDSSVDILVSGMHRGRRGNTMEASTLADLLNIGYSEGGRPYKRSRTSVNVSPYSSIARATKTAGWITSARLAFAAARRGA